MSTLGIDPGFASRGAGNAVAVVSGPTAVAWFERLPSPRDVWRPSHAEHLGTLLAVGWEQPQADSRTASPTTLIRLAVEGGTLAGLYAGLYGVPIVPLTPTAWKGSAHKPQHHRRLWLTLDEVSRVALGGARTERAIREACQAGGLDRWRKPGGDYYPASFATHNLLDAVGIARAAERRTV